MLSLAGIPPLAGFFGKFYLFAAAANAGGGNLGLLWLVILAIAASVVSLYYYLMVLKQAYVLAPETNGGRLPGIAVETGCAVALSLGVVLLGCFPSAVLNLIEAACASVH
jgi:NADH-quinone oxidoreductase subunit N